MSASTPDRVIGIGASAGGIEALVNVLGELPEDFPHAVCVTLHVRPDAPSVLPRLLDRRCALTVTAARSAARLKAGWVFVAPPDHHLLVRGDHISLSHAPKENGVRPAVDAMLRSIAACGRSGVAVVLSGALGDGSDGAGMVLAAGGAVFVQDPEDAVVSSMPARTLELVDGGARILTAKEIGSALAQLGPAEDEDGETSSPPLPGDVRPDGPATGFTCPECNGAIWEVREGGATRYRCRIGHSYSEEAFVRNQGSAVEAALWAALEVLEERAELLRRIAEQRVSSEGMRKQLHDKADEAAERAKLVRRALEGDVALPRPRSSSAAR